MDPLSIIASALTLAGTVQLGVNALLQLYGAPAELCALSNELADLTVVLKEISGVFETKQDDGSQSRSNGSNAELVVIVQSTKAKLEALQLEVTKLTTGTRHKRLKRVLVCSKLNSFKSSMQTQRIQLITLLSASSVISLASVQITVREVSAVVNELATQRDATHHGLLQISKRLESIETLIAGPGNDEVTLVGDDSADDVSKSDKGPSVTVTNIDTTAVTGEMIQSTSTESPNANFLLDACAGSKADSFDAVAIKATRPLKTPCSSWCTCSCHQHKSFRSPPLFELIMGGLFVGYSGRPTLSTPCDNIHCRARSCPSEFRVTYVFPRWFLSKIVDVAVTMAAPAASGLAVFFAMHRTVPGDSSIFYYAKTGNVEGLKTLFTSGVATPNDVHCESGVVALDFAISYRKIDTIKFLLDAGANPLIRSKIRGACPSDKAWSKVLCKSLQPREEDAFRHLFAHTEDIDGRNLTVLHRIVLLLETRVTLREELRKLSVPSSDTKSEPAPNPDPTSLINARDALGQTPLSLAAELGSAPHIRLLLSPPYSASPHIPAHCQKDPLIFAARSTNPQAVSLLLAAGADPLYHTDYHHTALHYAGIWAPGLSVRYLCEAGAVVDFQDNDGRTPLGFAVLSGNIGAGRELVRRGARCFFGGVGVGVCPGKNVKGGSLEGVDPFLGSIRGNKHDFLELFVGKGRDLRGRRGWENVCKGGEVLEGGRTLLHVVGEFADKRTMGLLGGCVGVGALALGKADDKGRTALDIVRGRGEEGLLGCFCEMLERSGGVVVGEKEDEEDGDWGSGSDELDEKKGDISYEEETDYEDEDHDSDVDDTEVWEDAVESL